MAQATSASKMNETHSREVGCSAAADRTRQRSRARLLTQHCEWGQPNNTDKEKPKRQLEIARRLLRVKGKQRAQLAASRNPCPALNDPILVRAVLCCSKLLAFSRKQRILFHVHFTCLEEGGEIPDRKSILALIFVVDAVVFDAGAIAASTTCHSG